VCEQSPVAGSQESAVQALWSSQDFSSWLQMCCVVSHVSIVQALPSLQSASVLQQPATGVPGLHTPSAHVSPLVHTLPSSQGAALLVWTHPVAGSQLSSVQILPSSQFGGGPPTQAPLLHVSSVVQASPSSQGVPSRAGLEQMPVAGSQMPAL